MTMIDKKYMDFINALMSRKFLRTHNVLFGALSKYKIESLIRELMTDESMQIKLITS